MNRTGHWNDTSRTGQPWFGRWCLTVAGIFFGMIAAFMLLEALR